VALGRRLRVNNQAGTLGAALTGAGITFESVPDFPTLIDNAYVPISPERSAGATCGTTASSSR